MNASVIVVNHNGGSEAVRNLRLWLEEADVVSAEVIVVDNASVDASPERIREALPEVRVVAEPWNRGYAAAVNRGLSEAAGPVLVVANADVAPRPGALRRLVADTRERTEFGILGGLLVDDRDRANPNCVRRLPGVTDILREGFFLPPRTAVPPSELVGLHGIVEAPAVSGAVLALRREALEAIGPMDENFFLYREDVEWCLRASRAGLRVGVVADAVFDHAGGASTRAAEGPAFAARLLSDFRYFVTIRGARQWVVRAFWSVRLAARSVAYSLDTTLGIFGRRESSRARAAIYRILADRLRSFEWSEVEGAQSCHPSRLVDLPFAQPPRGIDRRPRVLLVVPDMSHGGAQRRIEYLAKGPLSREFRFDVLCLRSVGAIGERIRGRAGVYAVGVKKWSSPATWRRIRDFSMLFSPDLVQSATLPADAAAFVGFAGRARRMSIKVSVDRWMTPGLRLFEWLVLRGARVVTANGDQTALAKSHLGNLGMLPVAIPNPPLIEIAQGPPRPFPTDGYVRLAVLGRLEPVKRVESFLAMASQLEKASPGRFAFHVLGDGSERAMLEDLARDLKLGGRVTFEGAVDDVASALDRMDVVLLFSEGDGNPFTVQETIARGRVPIVRHAGGAIDSLPDSLSDCFVHSSSPSAFAAKVKEVVERSDDVLARVHAAKDHLRDRRRFFEIAMRDAYRRGLGRCAVGGKVRVLHVLTRLIVGGAQENTIASVARVDPDCFESHLWTGPQTGSEGSLIADARARGIVVKVLPSLIREISFVSDLAVTLELAWLLWRDRFSIVHTHCSKAGIVARIAARIAMVPCVVHTAHGWAFHDHMDPLRKWFYVTLERLLEHWTTRVVSVSDRTTRVGLERGIGTPASYELIRSGIPLTEFFPDRAKGAAMRARLGIPEHDIVIGSVGRLSAQKNPLDFVSVIAGLCARRDDLTFLYVGDGPLRATVERAIKGAGVGERVRLLGVRDDVPDLLRAMDLFVLTSLWEGLPRVILQALATGVPVVAYDVAGIEEAVTEGGNGHLVPPGGVGAMIERLTSLIEDPEKRFEMGQRAVADFDRAFSEDGMIEALEDLYARLLWRPGVEG
jgi:glycosyltransferase involved in cell wall biosynthesis/GT2 family glycosyltransferase